MSAITSFIDPQSTNKAARQSEPKQRHEPRADLQDAKDAFKGLIGRGGSKAKKDATSLGEAPPLHPRSSLKRPDHQNQAPVTNEACDEAVSPAKPDSVGQLTDKVAESLSDKKLATSDHNASCKKELNIDSKKPEMRDPNLEAASFNADPEARDLDKHSLRRDPKKPKSEQASESVTMDPVAGVTGAAPKPVAPIAAEVAVVQASVPSSQQADAVATIEAISSLVTKEIHAQKALGTGQTEVTISIKDHILPDTKVLMSRSSDGALIVQFVTGSPMATGLIAQNQEKLLNRLQKDAGSKVEIKVVDKSGRSLEGESLADKGSNKHLFG